jgi:hypothetical protein
MEEQLRCTDVRVRELRAALSKVLDLGQADPFSRVCVLVREALIRDASIEQVSEVSDDHAASAVAEGSRGDLTEVGELILVSDLGEWIPIEVAERARGCFRDVRNNWYRESDEWLTWKKIRAIGTIPRGEQDGQCLRCAQCGRPRPADPTSPTNLYCASCREKTIADLEERLRAWRSWAVCFAGSFADLPSATGTDGEVRSTVERLVSGKLKESHR